MLTVFLFALDFPRPVCKILYAVYCLLGDPLSPILRLHCVRIPREDFNKGPCSKPKLLCLRFKVCLDVSEVVKLLCAVGFSVRHLDTSEPYDVTPTGDSGQERRGGCRVVVSCTTSGLRAVLETVGEECRCTSKQLNLAASNNQVVVVEKPTGI